MEQMSQGQLLNSALREHLDRDVDAVVGGRVHASPGPNRDMQMPEGEAGVANERRFISRGEVGTKLPTYPGVRFSGEPGQVGVKEFTQRMHDFYCKHDLVNRCSELQLVMIIKEGLEGGAWEVANSMIWANANDLINALLNSFPTLRHLSQRKNLPSTTPTTTT